MGAFEGCFVFVVWVLFATPSMPAPRPPLTEGKIEEAALAPEHDGGDETKKGPKGDAKVVLL